MTSPDPTRGLAAYLAAGRPVSVTDVPELDSLSRQRRSTLIGEFEQTTGVKVARKGKEVLWTDHLVDLLCTARNRDLPLAEALLEVLDERGLTYSGPPPSPAEFRARCQSLEARLQALEQQVTQHPVEGVQEEGGPSDDEAAAYLRTLAPFRELEARVEALRAQQQEWLDAWSMQEGEVREQSSWLRGAWTRVMETIRGRLEALRR